MVEHMDTPEARVQDIDRAALTCTDCPHHEHEPFKCEGLITRHFSGWSNVNGAPYGAWDADDQPCPCDVGPLEATA